MVGYEGYVNLQSFLFIIVWKNLSYRRKNNSRLQKINEMFDFVTKHSKQLSLKKNGSRVENILIIGKNPEQRNQVCIIV